MPIGIQFPVDFLWPKHHFLIEACEAEVVKMDRFFSLLAI